MLSTLGMTPIGALLHDPPSERSIRVPRCNEQHHKRTLDLLAIGQLLTHALAVINPVVARRLARCWVRDNQFTLDLQRQDRDKPCPGAVMLSCPVFWKPAEIIPESRMGEDCDGSSGSGDV